jgi:type IV secretory pathway VirB10-like protein
MTAPAEPGQGAGGPDALGPPGVAGEAPSVPPSAIEFRPGSPRVRRIRRTAVVATVGLVAGIAIMAVADGLRKPAANTAVEKEKDTPAPVPGDVINRMPATYDAIAAPPKLGPPRPGEFGATADARIMAGQAGTAVPAPQSAEDKEFERAEMERVKRAGMARTSGLAYASAGALGAVIPGAPAGAGGAINDAMGERALRQRLDELQRLQPGVAGGAADGLAAALGTRGADTAQDDKNAFQAKRRTADPYLQQAIIDAPTVPVLGAGAIIPGIFLTGINSDLPGQITGQVSQNVYDSLTGNHLLIPQGSMLVGEYDAKVTFGQERVLLVWTRLRMPNGSSLSLEGMPGVDLSGYAGVTDQVNNHWMKLIGGVVFGSVIGAGAQVAQGSNSVLNPSFGQLAVQGAGQNINQAGQDITRRNIGIQPTLEIRPGMRFNVFVTKDVILPEYLP